MNIWHVFWNSEAVCRNTKLCVCFVSRKKAGARVKRFFQQMLFFLSERGGDQDELLQDKTKIFHMLNFEVLRHG